MLHEVISPGKDVGLQFPRFSLRLLVGLILLLSFVRTAVVRAQTMAPPQLSSAEPYFADLFHRSGSTGMVVVVVRGGETWTESYGGTYPGSHQKPDVDSLVRLCSLSKIMTTDVLVKMVAERRVSLSDPLQKFAPHNVTVPVRTVRGQIGRPITLGDLATHTAGLPREIAYPEGAAGHFTFPDYTFRWQWLPGFRLRTAPGTAAHYSNIGFDLLADALSAAAGKPYPQLFAERISGPLGLRDTTLSPTPGECARLFTLGDLATHTAGLPREIAYPEGAAGHFTFPDYTFRWQWLPGFRLRTAPGTAAHYSNIGFDLLADALSAAAGKPYPQLFAERISGPLGLRDTTLSPSPGECARLLIPARDGGPCTDTTASHGSGGMYSTARDMTRWLKYLLALPGVPMHQDPAATAIYIPVAQLRWTQGMAHAGTPTGIGLGWVHIQAPDEPAEIIEKTGGGAGYSTYIALSPSRHVGLFVASTDGRRRGPNVFGGSNDLLMYLAGLSPAPDVSLQPVTKKQPLGQ